MGFYGKLEEKTLAIKLRKKGYSYNQILQRVSVSKGTVSLWCRDINLTLKQTEVLLKRKLKGAEKGRFITASNKKRIRLDQIKKYKNEGINEIGKLNKRDRFMVGVALYAGEGSKKSLGFANSDPLIIICMMSWFREFCKVPESKLKGAIWIHDNLDARKALEFWSKIAKIPTTQFYKTYVVKNKINSGKIRKNIHSYGVFSVRISDIKLHRKVMGWMSGILQPKLV